jgi:periplasmic divalent cation tolerance protein
MNEHLVVLVTAANDRQARQIARRLLQKKLAACVNFVPVESMFLWEGEIQEEDEVLLIIKTRTDAFDDLLTNVRVVHTYDNPEIIGAPIVMGADEYLKWINHEVTG